MQDLIIFLGKLAIALFIVRFHTNLYRLGFNPVAAKLNRATDPLVLPFRKLLPPSRFDFGAVIVAAIIALFVAFILIPAPLALPIALFILILVSVWLNTVFYAILITVIGSWLQTDPRQPVMQAVAAGRQVLLEVDLSGARQIRRSLPGAYQVFLLPPSWEELERRLRGRDTEDAATVARRLETARDELAAVDEFDAVVVNDEVADTVAQLVQLLGLGSDETNATRQVPERLTSEGT